MMPAEEALRIPHTGYLLAHSPDPIPPGPASPGGQPTSARRPNVREFRACELPRTPQGVEKPSLSAEGISCDASERYTTRVDWEPAGAGRPPAPLASDPSRR